jgi:hypothetical protein
MPLAYCILAHKNPIQVNRLLRAIWKPYHLYCIHFDARVFRVAQQDIRSIASAYKNVNIMPPQFVHWGRFSQIARQLEGLRMCLCDRTRWTHFINLSGQDFPIRTQNEIESELDCYLSRSFVNHFDPFDSVHWSNSGERLSRVFLDNQILEWTLQVRGLGRYLRRILGWTNKLASLPLIRRRAPRNLRWVGGSNHVILSRAHAEYLAYDDCARKAITWLRGSGHPDESVYQTALLNSRFADGVSNDDRRMIAWEGNGEVSPRILTSKDVGLLCRARDAGRWFARKFDADVDQDILSYVETQFLGS